MCSSEIHRRCPAAQLSLPPCSLSVFFLSSPAALKRRQELPDGEDQVAFENPSQSLLNPGARAGQPGGPARPGSTPPGLPKGDLACSLVLNLAGLCWGMRGLEAGSQGPRVDTIIFFKDHGGRDWPLPQMARALSPWGDSRHLCFLQGLSLLALLMFTQGTVWRGREDTKGL